MSEILQSDPQDDGEPPSYNFLNYDVTEARRPWLVMRQDHDDVFNYMDLTLSFIDRQKQEDIKADIAATNHALERRAQLDREAIEQALTPTLERRHRFGVKIMRLLHITRART
jgi:hypothetical protein